MFLTLAVQGAVKYWSDLFNWFCIFALAQGFSNHMVTSISAFCIT